MRHSFPYIRPGMTIGLLGGSFDPPHKGHELISLAAMRRFGLDQLWWLVTPGNPLKPNPPAPLERRMQASRALLSHPRIVVSDLEAQFGTRYTAQTLRSLRRAYPHVNFVWLMGADNLAHFHQWKDWRQIIETVPIGILARPGDRISARLSPAAKIYAAYRVPGNQSQRLARTPTPAWCFLNVPMRSDSSTEIRKSGRWA